MPWRCPVCSTPIQHTEAEDVPRRGARYRCHVCRLELLLDPDTETLAVAPPREGDHHGERSTR